MTRAATPTGGVFLYGFGPYGVHERNVTEALVRALPPLPGLRTAVFPVRFSRTMLLAPLRGEMPAVIIGLGQHPRARKLRLERRATNLRARSGEAARAIVAGGPAYRFVNLALPQTAETTVTYDAGTYVCNFSMYVMLEYCRARGARFGFIHVPKAYDVAAAADYLLRALACLRSPQGPGT